MKVHLPWLQNYFEGKLPNAATIREAITMHAFEVEEVYAAPNGTECIDIKILPDRAHDCLSHFGIALEISGLLSLPLKGDYAKPLQEQAVVSYPLSKKVTVDIAEASQLCRRYMSALVEGVKVGPSPAWLKDALEAIGQRSINNIVDATNYVMFDVGQPLHAFDAKKLTEKNGGLNIVVRTSKAGEKITLLDGKEVELQEGTLYIADGNSNDSGSSALIGIAGVKGGKRAEVDANTTSILLESANFHPTAIGKVARKMGLLTDASKRFENEITPELAALALKKVIELIVSLAGESSDASGSTPTVEGIVDIYPKREREVNLGVSLSEINAVLGSSITKNDVEGVLKRYGYKYKIVKPAEEVISVATSLVGTPYKLGASVRYEAPDTFDCSGFAGYVFMKSGYNLPRMSVDQMAWAREISKEELQPGDLIFNNGEKETAYYKTQEYMKSKDVPSGVDHVGIYLGNGKIIHATKWSDTGTLIEDLATAPRFQNIVGYRRVIENNEERFVVTRPIQRLDMKCKEDVIEEIGRAYGYEQIASSPLAAMNVPMVVNKNFYYAQKIRLALYDRGYSEVYTYGFQAKGEVELQNPLASDKKFLRKGLVAGLASALEHNAKYADFLFLDRVAIFEIGNVFSKDAETMMLGIAIQNVKKLKIKEADELKAAVEAVGHALGITGGSSGAEDSSTFPAVYDKTKAIVEINLSALIAALPQPAAWDVNLAENPDASYERISPYPFSVRDVALFVPSEVKADDVFAIIKREAGELMVKSKLFDVFTKKQEDGTSKTSYAYRLILQSKEKTLEEAEITAVMDRVYKALSAQNGWQIR